MATRPDPITAALDAALACQLERTRPELAALVAESVRAGDPATETLAAARRAGASPALLRALRAFVGREHAKL